MTLRAVVANRAAVLDLDTTEDVLGRHITLRRRGARIDDVDVAGLLRLRSCLEPGRVVGVLRELPAHELLELRIRAKLRRIDRPTVRRLATQQLTHDALAWDRAEHAHVFSGERRYVEMIDPILAGDVVDVHDASVARPRRSDRRRAVAATGRLLLAARSERTARVARPAGAPATATRAQRRVIAVDEIRRVIVLGA